MRVVVIGGYGNSAFAFWKTAHVLSAAVVFGSS